MRETIRKVATLIGPGQGGRWAVVSGMAVAVTLVEAASTFVIFAFLGALVDKGGKAHLPLVGDLRGLLPWEGFELLAALGIATAVVFVTRSGLVLAQNYAQFRVAEKAGARLSARLLDGYLGMPYEFHLQRNSSELIRNAFDSVRRFVGEGLIPGVRAMGKIGIVVGVVGVLLASSPLSTVLALAALGPLTWVVLRVVHPRIKRLGRTAQSMINRNLQTLQQSLHGVRDIAVLGREAAFVDSYRDDRMELARVRYLRQTAAQVPRAIIEAGVMLFVVGFVSVTALVEGGVREALPMLGLFGYAAARLMPEIQEITQALNHIKFVGPAVDDIYSDLKTVEAAGAERVGSGEAVVALPFTEVLSARGVGYTYPGTDSHALRGVDLDIHQGECVGIVGPTGGGKSTLVDVLVGLLVPTEGRVLVDGADLHVNARAWQRNLGIVPQMVFVIDDSLRANIALGVPEDEVDDEAVQEALAVAQLGEFVASLPDGLESVVGEDGVGLSGGQRQRLAIARALYRRPSVVVFDEGTSSVDRDTEAAVMDALARLHGEVTLIMVAHRLSTVEHCDTVFLVSGGGIVDRGTYRALASRHEALQGA